ncbi:serine/threonine-protein kinase Nek11-like [Micropterus salmoides]|uniref:serine/threonine-protein kinase Nek11-like n=1 Tax=Micropterus salmoides TaxID=27706 RepID=UPI0018EB682C|nr:serine/threonine-protein kinase Nek11-like [Micropterus salmoides]
MLRFKEVESGQAPPPGSCGLVAKRYSILQSLGRGSFGSVYLVQDSRAADGEELKVLKQIPLGDLRPDETVRATQEAHLLSQLHHPAILTFYHSFLERDAFCIVTEFCQKVLSPHSALSTPLMNLTLPSSSPTTRHSAVTPPLLSALLQHRLKLSFLLSLSENY